MHLAEKQWQEPGLVFSNDSNEVENLLQGLAGIERAKWVLGCRLNCQDVNQRRRGFAKFFNLIMSVRMLLRMIHHWSL